MGGLLQPVDPIAPVAPIPSILTTARALPSAIEWKSGIAWRPTIKPGNTTSAVDDIVDLEDCPTPTDLSAGDPPDDASSLPQLARLPFECEEVLPGQVDQFREEARAALAAATAWYVSQQFNTAIDAAATDLDGSDPSHPVTAMAVLLANYLDCTRLGGAIISVPPVLIPTLIGAGVVKQSGDVYQGPMGSLVNPGPHGNWDTSEDDPAVTTGTMYVSGPIEFALGPISVPPGDREAFWDRTTNLYRIEAQRAFITRFDPDCTFKATAFLPAPASAEGVA